MAEWFSSAHPEAISIHYGRDYFTLIETSADAIGKSLQLFDPFARLCPTPLDAENQIRVPAASGTDDQSCRPKVKINFRVKCNPPQPKYKKKSLRGKPMDSVGWLLDGVDDP
jgi:hypothetical protein